MSVDDNQLNDDANNDNAKNHDYSKIKVFINPQIISKTGTIEYEEGCLSVTGIYAKVTRAAEIELKYQDEVGHEYCDSFSDLAAICIQHEIDHLDGIVFVERLSRLKQDMIIKKIKKSLLEM
jgi:peptide deformylase